MNITEFGFTAVDTGSGTAHQYGPFTVSDVQKLLRVSAQMAVVFEGSTAGVGSTLSAGIAWGVQWGPSGYTPAVLPAQIGAGYFLWSGLAQSNDGGTIAWAPSSDTAAVFSYNAYDYEWYGQQQCNESIDLYVTSGAVPDGMPPWEATVTLTGIYSY